MDQTNKVKHRQIVLRQNGKVFDTGFTTGSSSEISDDDFLKRRLSSLQYYDSIAKKKFKTTPRRESGDTSFLTSSPRLQIHELTDEQVVSPARPNTPDESLVVKESIEYLTSYSYTREERNILTPEQIASPINYRPRTPDEPEALQPEPVVSPVKSRTPDEPEASQPEPVVSPVKSRTTDELEALQPESVVTLVQPRKPDEPETLQPESMEPSTSKEIDSWQPEPVGNGLLPDYPTPVVGTPKLFEFESPDSEAEQPEVHVVSEKKRDQGKRLAEYTRRLRASGGVKKPKRKSERAGLILPVSRFLKKMKNDFPNYRVQTNAAIYLTGVVEYVLAELLEISGEVAREMNRKRITPRHILLAIKNDPEFTSLCRDVDIMQGGVMPSIQPESTEPLRKKRSAGYKRAESMQELSGQAEKRDLRTTTKEAIAKSSNLKKSPPRSKRGKKESKKQRGKWLAEFMRKKREADKQAKLGLEKTSGEEKPSSQAASQATQSSLDETYEDNPLTPPTSDQSESSDNDTSDYEDEPQHDTEHKTTQYNSPDQIKKNSLKRTLSH